MNDDDFLDRIKDDDEDLYRSYVKPVSPLKTRIFFWLMVISGIGIGICLFLFFLTLFVYVFLPVAAVFLIWFSIKRWQFNRAWRKIEKEYYKESQRNSAR